MKYPEAKVTGLRSLQRRCKPGQDSVALVPGAHWVRQPPPRPISPARQTWVSTESKHGGGHCQQAQNFLFQCQQGGRPKYQITQPLGMPPIDCRGPDSASVEPLPSMRCHLWWVFPAHGLSVQRHWCRSSGLLLALSPHHNSQQKGVGTGVLASTPVYGKKKRKWLFKKYIILLTSLLTSLSELTSIIRSHFPLRDSWQPSEKLFKIQLGSSILISCDISVKLQSSKQEIHFYIVDLYRDPLFIP